MVKLYSIKDTKGGFQAPFIAQNDALAVRTIKSYVNSGKDIVCQYPEDFELWRVGEFDEVTGIVKAEELTCVIRLNALVDVSGQNA